MKLFYIVITFLLFIGLNNANAQNKNENWIFEIGISTIDVREYTTNFGDNLNDYFGLDEWADNVGFKVAAEKFINNNFSIQVAATFNSINTVVIKDDFNDSYFSIDANLKYHLNGFLSVASWFDPYVNGGFGYQSFDKDGSLMLIGGLGSNFWVSEKFGINIQTGYKHNFISSGRDVFQHSIGLVFTFGERTASGGNGIWGK